MTLLIFSHDVKNPDYCATSTALALQKVFPNEKIEYSCTFDLIDKSSDTRFTLVIPGGFLPDVWMHMNKNGANQRCVEEVNDQGTHFIGFCAGAYYAANSTVAQKNHADPYYYFDDSRMKEFMNSNGPSLDLCEHVAAIGPFLPDNKIPVEMHKLHGHLVKLYDCEGKTSFNSLYMEGPLFLGMSYHGVYGNQECIRATYLLPQDLNEITVTRNFFAPLRYPINAKKDTIPAVIHTSTKNSHRYLFSAHVEFASIASTFLPLYNQQNPRRTSPMTDEELKILISPESEKANLEFLQRTLRFKM